MQRTELIRRVLLEIGAVDANEEIDGDDANDIEKYLSSTIAQLRSRDILQTVIGDDIPDKIALPLVLVVSYYAGPSYGYGRSEGTRLRAETDLFEATRAPYRSEPLRTRNF